MTSATFLVSPGEKGKLVPEIRIYEVNTHCYTSLTSRVTRGLTVDIWRFISCDDIDTTEHISPLYY